MKINKLTKHILRIQNPFYTFMFASLILFFGIWLLFPFVHFTTITFGSHYVWGAVASTIGFGTLICMKFKSKYFLNGVFFQFLYWSILGTVALLSNFHSPAFIINYWLATMCALGYVNRKFWDENKDLEKTII